MDINWCLQQPITLFIPKMAVQTTWSCQNLLAHLHTGVGLGCAETENQYQDASEGTSRQVNSTSVTNFDFVLLITAVGLIRTNTWSKSIPEFFVTMPTARQHLPFYLLPPPKHYVFGLSTHEHVSVSSSALIVMNVIVQILAHILNVKCNVTLEDVSILLILRSRQKKWQQVTFNRLSTIASA